MRYFDDINFIGIWGWMNSVYIRDWKFMGEYFIIYLRICFLWLLIYVDDNLLWDKDVEIVLIFYYGFIEGLNL